jgi:hypothetical protein
MIVTSGPHEMQHIILIGINTQVGKMMLIFRPALKNESWSEENYSWSAKPAITSHGEHYARTRAPENQQYFSMLE